MAHRPLAECYRQLPDSRRLTSNPTTARWFWTHKQQATQRGHRLPILIEMESAADDQRRAFVAWLQHQQLFPRLLLVSDLVEALLPVSPGKLSETNPGFVDQITANKFTRMLGQEFDAIVYDMYTGFHPDAVAALSGTLRAGGSFMLLGPQLDHWGDFADPDYERLLAYPLTRADVAGHFLQYFSTALKHSRQWGRFGLVGRQLSLITEPRPRSTPKAPPIIHSAGLPKHKNGLVTRPTPDQQKLIARVLDIKPRQSQALVVTAGRGRGKSAGLGMAVSQWQMRYSGEIWVTAPSKAALVSFDKFLSPESQTHYFPPDELLQRGQQTEKPQLPQLLVIDEAAAIPTSLLKALAGIFPVILFATTTHGYEGTGQGFTLKLFPALKQHFPKWKEIALHQPIRWQRADPLEAFIENTFRLTKGSVTTAKADSELLNLRKLSLSRTLPEDLIASPEVLTQLMELLTIAHYRTTPDDLRTLLDSPGIVLYTGWHLSRLVGVVMVSLETPFTDNSMISAIWQGQRRPRGHLLQQSLAQQLCQQEALQLAMARVIRIAVHPLQQHQGIGSWLLGKVRNALKQQVQVLGASFAGEPEVVSFWQKNGYKLVRVGTRQDHVSGTYAALVLAGTQDPGRQLVKTAQRRFSNRCRYDLSLHKYPHGYLEQLTGNAATTIPPAKRSGFSSRKPLSDIEWQMLGLFADGCRPFETIEDLLPRIPHLSGHQGLHWLKERIAKQLPADLSELAVSQNLTGRKQAVILLRSELQHWIQQYR